jgi:hypothetical protein
VKRSRSLAWEREGETVTFLWQVVCFYIGLTGCAATFVGGQGDGGNGVGWMEPRGACMDACCCPSLKRPHLHIETMIHVPSFSGGLPFCLGEE